MTFLVGLGGVLLVFGLVIFVHEFGHFIVAKKTGVKVERFSFGLGPELWGFQWGETRYCLAWIPLGGEVRMAGEMELEDGAPVVARDPRDFFAKPWYARLPIVLAGPAMNYVLAVILFALIGMIWGEPQVTTEPWVGEVVSGFPAQEAGLLSGDRILSIDGAPVTRWKEAAEKIHQAPGRQVSLDVQRADQKLTLQLTPRRDPVSGRGLIGITPHTDLVRVSPAASLGRGVHQAYWWSAFTLKELGSKIWNREKPDVAGPIGIAAVVAKAAQAGWEYVIQLMAIISVGVGLFNLFPIPMLDGGHMMYYIIEGLRGKPLGKRFMQSANAVGLSLLLALLVFATFNDIQRLRPAPQKVEGH